jgi:hypothetical protein
MSRVSFGVNLLAAGESVVEDGKLQRARHLLTEAAAQGKLVSLLFRTRHHFAFKAWEGFSTGRNVSNLGALLLHPHPTLRRLPLSSTPVDFSPPPLTTTPQHPRSPTCHVGIANTSHFTPFLPSAYDPTSTPTPTPRPLPLRRNICPFPRALPAPKRTCKPPLEGSRAYL